MRMYSVWHIYTLLLISRYSSAYWLMGANNILTIQRIDPVMSPGIIATHVHSVVGGSNFAFNTSTAFLRQSECTSMPIPQDKSNYWFPLLYWQRWDGTFTSVDGNVVIYYLFSDTKDYTTAFPEDFRMISGDPTLRTFDPSSFAQQAVTFLCLDFERESKRYNELPVWKECPAGIRAEINFPSCWDGQNVDSEDHRSHVTFPSTGPDNGTCNDPDYPVTIPRIFMEVYFITHIFNDRRGEAMTPSQPFVFSNGDPTGYGFHADFFNGWQAGVLERAVNDCSCNPYGDPACCVGQGIFDFQQTTPCFITNTVEEQTTGNLSVLAGANPVQAPCYEQYYETSTPAILAPAHVYTTSSTPPVSVSTAIPARSNTRQAQSAEGTCIREGGALKDGPVRFWILFVLLVLLVLCNL